MEWFRIFKENFPIPWHSLSVDICPLSEAAFTLLFQQSPLSASIVVCSIRLCSFISSSLSMAIFSVLLNGVYFLFLFELEKALFSNESLRQREIYSFEMLGDGTNRCLMIFRVSRGEKFFFSIIRHRGGDVNIRVESGIECANIWFLWELNFFKVFAAFESIWAVELRAMLVIGWDGKENSSQTISVSSHWMISHHISLKCSLLTLQSCRFELNWKRRSGLWWRKKKQKNWKNSLFFCSRRCCSHSHLASAWYSIQFLLFSSCAASSTRIERNRIEHTEIELGDSLGN